MSSNREDHATLAANYFGLKGKVALVTGASSGLGKHFSTVLASAGCDIALLARREPALLSLKDELSELGVNVISCVCDITIKSDVEKSITQVSEQLGTPTLLINNAGVAAPAKFIDAQDEDTDLVINTNQQAVWHVSQVFCKQLIADGQAGTIINIASILGLDVLSGVASYAVSKAAVVQLTKVMALELARHGIRVNAIAPGYFSTEINEGFLESAPGQKLVKRIPMRRPGELHELDGLLLLLASEKGSFMTGSVVPVDGGHLVAGF